MGDREDGNRKRKWGQTESSDGRRQKMNTELDEMEARLRQLCEQARVNNQGCELQRADEENRRTWESVRQKVDAMEKRLNEIFGRPN